MKRPHVPALTSLAMLMHGPKHHMAEGGPVGSEPPGSHEFEPHHHAMNTFIEAVHERNPHKAHEALMDWHELKDDSSETDDAEDDMKAGA